MKKFMVPVLFGFFIVFAYTRTDLFTNLIATARQIFSAGQVAVENLKKQYEYIVRVFADPAINFYVTRLDLAKKAINTAQVAHVRKGNAIAQEETRVIANRKKINKNAQEALIGKQIQQPLVIGVSCSGGGVRAMVSAIGSLCGLEKIKLLDCVTYLGLLSGSTWIAPWFVYGNQINEYKKIALPNLTTGLLTRTSLEVKTLVDKILIQLSEKKTVTLINLFDALLVNMVFRDFGTEKFTKHLLTQFENIKTGRMPFPINTAVMLHPKITGSEWVEFSPIEIGSEYLSAWVPTWGFNRTFKNGQSIDFSFDYPFYLGTYGGAVGMNIDMVYRHSLEKNFSAFPVPINTIAKNLMESLLGQKLNAKQAVRDTRVQPIVSVFRNFTYGMAQSPLQDEETIEMTDGGLNFNSPIAPLVRKGRGVDVIIIFDNSAGEGIFQGRELQKIVEYIKNKNLPFPNISDQEIAAAGKKTITVFKDNDPQIPVVIYMPRYKDVDLWNSLKNDPEFERFKSILEPFDPQTCATKSYCNTFNFNYALDQSEQLSAFTEFNVLANKDILIDVLKFAVERKNK